MKVVINSCFGGFGLSHKAIMLYVKLSGFKLYMYKNDTGSDEYVRIENGVGVDNTSVFYFKAPLKNGKYESGLHFYDHDLQRDDPVLVKVVEELGAEANGLFAKLSVVEIPDGIKWEITEYDGSETIEEEHRSWS